MAAAVIVAAKPCTHRKTQFPDPLKAINRCVAVTTAVTITFFPREAREIKLFRAKFSIIACPIAWSQGDSI
jgi:hypothetical protein